MQSKNVYAGPILRRAQDDLVCIWLATWTSWNGAGYVRKAADQEWIPSTSKVDSIHLFSDLWVHLVQVAPIGGRKFPRGTLMEYSLADSDESGVADHQSFERFVSEDGLSYPGYKLPTFYLQSNSQPLNVLYGSCRKPHGIKGGDNDALAFGDKLIFSAPSDLTTRPSILCLGGDQIYADDVDDSIFDLVMSIARRLDQSVDASPQGRIASKGDRGHFLKRFAKCSSGESANHLVAFAEYVAMYGIVWNANLWPESFSPSKNVEGFLRDLPYVRRLLANIATYMIFDDHDVTDDWNLSVDWMNQAADSPMGLWFLENGLTAFWLFQGWGNDPKSLQDEMPHILELFDRRFAAAGGSTSQEWPTLASKLSKKKPYFVDFQGWEFATPSYPAVYFFDTRTRRDTVTGEKGGSTDAPAFLKSIKSWTDSFAKVRTLVSTQGQSVPLVFVCPGPVFGFPLIDLGAALINFAAGAEPYDFEAWGANDRLLVLFGQLLSGKDVVILSGDVHYAYTSTVRFDVFDDDSYRRLLQRFRDLSWLISKPGMGPSFDYLGSTRFIQLTSSALRNYASSALETAANFRGTGGGWYIDSFWNKNVGWYKRNYFVGLSGFNILNSGDPHGLIRGVRPKFLRPRGAFVQQLNDVSNSGYYSKHNLGYARFVGRSVTNSFLTVNGRENIRSWNFGGNPPWGSPV